MALKGGSLRRGWDRVCATEPRLGSRLGLGRVLFYGLSLNQAGCTMDYL